jgi:hypothetical protein
MELISGNLGSTLSISELLRTPGAGALRDCFEDILKVQEEEILTGQAALEILTSFVTEAQFEMPVDCYFDTSLDGPPLPPAQLEPHHGTRTVPHHTIPIPCAVFSVRSGSSGASAASGSSSGMGRGYNSNNSGCTRPRWQNPAPQAPAPWNNVPRDITLPGGERIAHPWHPERYSWPHPG